MVNHLSDPNVMAIFGAFLIFYIVLIIIYYIYSALVVMTIAKKTNTDNAWLAWIPFANIYLMTKIGKVSPWTLLAIPAVFVPFFGIFILFA